MTEHRSASEVVTGLDLRGKICLVLDGVGGRYLEDVRLGLPSRGENDGSGYAEHAVDPEIARRLWTLSEKLVGERFSF